MKRLILLSLFFSILTPASVYSQSKIDLLSRVRLRDANMNLSLPLQNGEDMPRRKSSPAPVGFTRALIVLNDGYDRSSLESEGVEVSGVLGGVALCLVPTDSVDRIASLDCVRTFTVDTPRQVMTHNARRATNVDAIHAGENLPQTYTGKNVVCGIFDQGIDPNHINFKDADGNTRISSLTRYYLNPAGQPVVSDYDSSNLHMFTTDEPGTYHGTHTLGIMAGGYRGALTAGYPEGKGVGDPNPYYGMAPDAELMVGCGPVSDYFIANGVYKIATEALSNNKPTVINISIGGNIGTHDGNSAMSQFLEAVGEECIVVMAAGNEGNVPLHATKTFSEGDTEFKSLLKAYHEPESNDYLRYGQVAFYSDDSSMFDVQGIVLNRKTGRIAYRVSLVAPGTGTATYHVTASDFAQSDDDVLSQPLSKYFNGYFGLGSAMDADTDKFYCVLDYYLTNNMEKNADDNYVPGFIVTANEGQTVRMWCDGTYTCLDSYGIEGWSEGTPDGSISDMATGNNIVVVGSYNTEPTLHLLNGTSEPFEPSLGEFIPGDITPFSAYGTLADGRTLPHVCAPGVSLVSSTSRYYVETDYNEVDPGRLSAKLEDDDLTYWWSQTGGTSMATPVVAGAIALWLEADPTLKVWDIIDIISSTAQVDDNVRNASVPVQWGAGKFDAYAGLVEVIRRSGITSVEADASPFLLTTSGNGQFTVALPGVERLDVDVYSISGSHVHSLSVNADSCGLDLSALASGVYVVRVNSSAPQKVFIR